jgi:hypothetical protein
MYAVIPSFMMIIYIHKSNNDWISNKPTLNIVFKRGVIWFDDVVYIHTYTDDVARVRWCRNACVCPPKWWLIGNKRGFTLAVTGKQPT